MPKKKDGFKTKQASTSFNSTSGLFNSIPEPVLREASKTIRKEKLYYSCNNKPKTRRELGNKIIGDLYNHEEEFAMLFAKMREEADHLLQACENEQTRLNKQLSRNKLSGAKPSDANQCSDITDNDPDDTENLNILNHDISTSSKNMVRNK